MNDLSKKSLLAATLFAAVLAGGCTLVEDGGGHLDTAAVINGQPDRGDYAVLYLRWKSSIGSNGCTATLIHPRIVLTAGHCIHRMHRDNDGERRKDVFARADEISLFVGNDTSAVTPYASPGTAVEVTDVLTSYDSCSGPACDVAVLILSNARDYPRPMPVNLDSGPEVGETVTAIGFGRTLESVPDQDDDPAVDPVLDPGAGGAKHRGESVVIDTSQGRLTTDTLTSYGDSGGPILHDGRIVAVTSGGQYYAPIYSDGGDPESRPGNHQLILEAYRRVGAPPGDTVGWPAEDWCSSPDVADGASEDQTAMEARDLGTLADYASIRSSEGNLHRADDVDYYQVRLTDGVGTLVPSVTFTSDQVPAREGNSGEIVGLQYEVCAGFTRDDRSRLVPPCEGVRELADDDETITCCVDQDIYSQAVHIDLGSVDRKVPPLNDSGRLLIRVKRKDGVNDCGTYQLQYGA